MFEPNWGWSLPAHLWLVSGWSAQCRDPYEASTCTTDLGTKNGPSSPLRRCRETAAAAADVLGLPVEVDDDLRELDFGEWEGLTRDEAMGRNPLALRRFFGATDVRAPGGESIADVGTRVARARQRILQKHAGETVLVVSHVTPIKLLLAAGLGVGDDVVHRVFLEAASLCTVAWSSDGRTSVRLVNDTSHLR